MKKSSTKNVKKDPFIRSKLGIAFASLLSAATLASTCVCFWQVNNSKTESSDFANSVNARIEVDPVAFEKEGGKSFENAQKNVKQSAETLSQWLKDQGQENYDVSYESYKNDDETFSAYLNARFTVDKIKDKKPTSKEEEDTKIDNDPYLSIFSTKGVNTNNRSIVYRWYMDPDSTTESDPTHFTIVNFKDLVTIPKDVSKSDNQTKVISNKDGKWGIMYHIQDNKLLNAIYNDMAKAYLYTQKEDPKSNAKTLDNWRQPRMYIVNNLEGMINEANYHVMTYAANERGTTGIVEWYRKVYSGTEYETFAKNYITGKDDRGKDKQANITSLAQARVSNETDPEQIKEESFTQTDNCDVLRYIDNTTPGTVANSFMSKYVEKTITINSKNFQTMFPEKITDEYKNEVDETCQDLTKTKLQYLWYDGSDKDHANETLAKISKYQMPCKIVNASVGAFTSEISDKLKTFKNAYLTVKVQPKFIDTIFGGNHVAGWLSIGFLVFLIALLVILACLYRMTGFLSWLCMMFMLSLTQLIATLSVSVISMSTLIGLFAVAIIGFVTCLGICGRIKRRLNSNEDTQVIVVKAFKKSLFPTLDFSIISLVFGICLTYIAPISLNVFGLLLIVGAFANFAITYLLNGGIQLLLFKNQLTYNKFNLFGKPSNKANEELRQGNMLVPSSLDASKLNFDYYSKANSRRIDLFTKKTWISLAVIAGVFVLGMILLGVLGFVTKSMFHSSTCVALYYTKGDLLSQPWFISSKLSYTYYRNYDNWWYFYTSDDVTSAVASLIGSGKLVAGETILTQTIFGSTNIDILSKTILAIIISATIITVYSMLRFNVASAVPALLGTFIMPMLMLAVAAIVQIKFDQTVVLGFALVTILNSCMLLNTLATIQDSWSRRDAYTREELRYIINTAYKSNWTFTWTVGLAMLILIICFGITSPNVPLNISIISIIGLMFFGTIISIGVTPCSVSYVEYFFLGFRNNILANRAKKMSSKVTVNYDEIDEQTIEGVNKFTKVKQIPIYEGKTKENNNEQNTTKNI